MQATKASQNVIICVFYSFGIYNYVYLQGECYAAHSLYLIG